MTAAGRLLLAGAESKSVKGIAYEKALASDLISVDLRPTGDVLLLRSGTAWIAREGPRWRTKLHK